MLKITSTEHLTGIRISGDWEDLNELYADCQPKRPPVPYLAASL